MSADVLAVIEGHRGPADPAAQEAALFLFRTDRGSSSRHREPHRGGNRDQAQAIRVMMTSRVEQARIGEQHVTTVSRRFVQVVEARAAKARKIGNGRSRYLLT